MKINVGAGCNPLPGYINNDRATGGEAFPLSQNGVVFDTGVADEIRASHVLEHFSHRATLDVLKEWVRVLKPGGTLKIAVPDFDYAVSQMGKHPHAPLWIMGGHVDGNDMHGAIFTRDRTIELLKDAGIHVTWETWGWTSEAKDCASLAVSLNIKGIKREDCIDVPKPVVQVRRKIVAIMSAPRVGFTHTHGCIETVLAAHGIQLICHTGAFWEQCIQNTIQQAIDEGYEDCITLDYDSAFSRDQFDRMYSYWLCNPEVDALSCVQPQRGTGLAMLTPLGKEEGDNQMTIQHTDKGFRVKTAHFGLTFLRLDKFKAIKKPWFWNQPDANGDWKKSGCVDADIYFWRKWNDAGNNLEILADVLLGHIEVVIGQIDPKTGRACYRYANDWNNDPYKGLMADVRDHPKEAPKDPVDRSAVTYDAMAVYHPEKEDYSTDIYPCSFQQRGSSILGQPSTDLSGSKFANV